MFTFMSIVSAVVYFTEDHLNLFDYLPIIGAPFAMAGLGYFIGLHHDPSAPD